MGLDIFFKDVFPSIFEHQGTISEGANPLELYASDEKNWDEWNMWHGIRNDWTRPYIFSMMRYYQKTDLWLFGGVYKVLGLPNFDDEYSQYVFNQEERDKKIKEIPH